MELFTFTVPQVSRPSSLPCPKPRQTRPPALPLHRCALRPCA